MLKKENGSKYLKIMEDLSKGIEIIEETIKNLIRTKDEYLNGESVKVSELLDLFGKIGGLLKEHIVLEESELFKEIMKLHLKA